MHWLVLHVVAMAVALVAAILVAILQDHLFKLFCLIPFALVFLIIYCWMNVFQLFQEMEPEADLPKPCKERRGFFVLLPAKFKKKKSSGVFLLKKNSNWLSFGIL